ncbi:hypothetical protein TMatcc_006616 [Talaromyces marneffei ATCC 18224]
MFINIYPWPSRRANRLVCAPLCAVGSGRPDRSDTFSILQPAILAYLIYEASCDRFFRTHRHTVVLSSPDPGREYTLQLRQLSAGCILMLFIFHSACALPSSIRSIAIILRWSTSCSAASCSAMLLEEIH